MKVVVDNSSQTGKKVKEGEAEQKFNIKPILF